MRVTLIGNANIDLIASPVDELPPPGTERVIGSIALRPGGAAAITALALAKLDVAPTLIAAIGGDSAGTILTDALVRAGIDTSRLVVVDEPTGICLAFESGDRDRSFLIAPASVAMLTVADVPPDVRADGAVFLGGYFLVPKLRGSSAAALFDAARDAGARTFLDTGWDPDGWPGDARDEVLALLPHVDVFLPNADEACRIASRSDPAQATDALQRTSGGWVVTKCGADGAVGAGPGGERFSLPAPTVSVVDTTGAGDAFNAGLLAGLAEGAAVPAAASFAIRVASAVVARSSADRYPSRAELTP